MPRIRTIKPDFFTSDTVSSLRLRTRLTWVGLWTHCDDYGRCRDNVKLIKAAVWPLDDVSLRDIESDITDLDSAGVLFRYAVGDKRYIQITNWEEHQKVDRPSKSAIPAPSELPLNHAPAELPADTRDGLASPRESASRARDGKGKEGNGREGNARADAREPPPRTCGQHATTAVPPKCGQCADARRLHDAWYADRNTRADSAPRCDRHDDQPAHNCAPCRSERIGAA